MAEEKSPKEVRVNIQFHQVLVPIIASTLTDAIYTNKMAHLQKGSVATEKEIMDEVFETWDRLIFNLSGKVSENLRFSFTEE